MMIDQLVKRRIGYVTFDKNYLKVSAETCL